MSNYYVLTIDPISDMFHIVDNASSVKLSLEIAGETAVFKDLKAGDLLLVYKKTPVSGINSIIRIQEVTEDTIVFKKKIEVETLINPEISEPDIESGVLHEISKSLYNSILTELLKKFLQESEIEEIPEDRDNYNRVKGGRNLLLYGVPGSGKSYTINGICSDSSVMERVVFHPDYAYSDFIGQIIPRLNNEQKVEYTFEPGPFTKTMQMAYKNPEKMYYLVIEEINRGNAPAIFGEVFQLLDRNNEGTSEYEITNYDIAKEVYGNQTHKVRIPSNLTLLATMNTSDQNVFTLDTAFQRRWDMQHISNRFDNKHADDMIEGSVINWGAFAQVINNRVEENSSEITGSGDKRLGAYFAKFEELKREKFSEKVLKYLWDDAFRMDKHAVFDKRMTSLEKVLETYQNRLSTEDPLKEVLDESVYRKMVDRMNEKNDTHSDE